MSLIVYLGRTTKPVHLIEFTTVSAFLVYTTSNDNLYAFLYIAKFYI